MNEESQNLSASSQAGMMKAKLSRRNFIQTTTLAASALAFAPSVRAEGESFPVVRTPENKRRFRSASIDAAIEKFKSSVGNKELGWLFENCFPNTLDTTVEYQLLDGRPDTYVITGDIDAMWLRDSSAQVWPYLHFINDDKPLKDLIAGVINRQTRCIHKDPYANAFYKTDDVDGHWKTDITEMRPGVHERKWEIDSLCYPIRLAYEYWKTCEDTAPFDAKWKEAIQLTLQTFREQQRKEGNGPYNFMRETQWATDTVPGKGYGNPAKKVGLIYSIFRPSDDATIFPYLVPANYFAMVSMRQAAEMVEKISGDAALATECRALADEVENALKEHAIVQHPKGGRVIAFEVDAYGNFYCTDDGNIPSVLSLPYLGAMKAEDELYQNTRKLLLSDLNPYWCIGSAANGLGGPHVGVDMIWPLGVIMQGLTSLKDEEIKECIHTLRKTHAGTGFMHEAFHKDEPTKFTRPWFAWANTIFGELLWKTFQEKPQLLS